MRTFIPSLLVTFLLAAALAPPAHAIPVASGETLQVDFSFSGDPSTPLGEIDVLALVLNATCSGFCGAPSASIDLFDGATWLGNNTQQFAQPFTIFAFTALTSAFTFRASQVTDFTSIADGSIDGLLKITNRGTHTFDFSVSLMYGASVGRSNGTNGYINGSPHPILGVQQVATVAEPPMLLLLATALLLWGASMRRRLTHHARHFTALRRTSEFA